MIPRAAGASTTERPTTPRVIAALAAWPAFRGHVVPLFRALLSALSDLRGDIRCGELPSTQVRFT